MHDKGWALFPSEAKVAAWAEEARALELAALARGYGRKGRARELAALARGLGGRGARAGAELGSN